MVKRGFDLILSVFLLIIFSPIMILLAWQITRKLGFPFFFCQVRPGLNAKPFNIIKFRTMVDCVDGKGDLLADEQRLTKFGRFLRTTSMDELPELWNVIKGDMSLVGPRPLLMDYLPLYSREQSRRHSLRPGITGWAQINGRNTLSWEEKFKYDVWYVDNRSFWLDIKILFFTVRKVFLREGIHSDGHVTAEKFQGTTTSDT